MEKGRGKGTDTLAMDNDFVRRGDVKCLLENTVCLHEELPAQIDIITAADVVPVVRCKECAYHDTADYGGGCTKNVCRLLDRQIQDDDYCSYALRKDGDGDV